MHDGVRPFIIKTNNFFNGYFNPSDEDILAYGIPVYEALKKINQKGSICKEKC